ncbi:MAG: hypothetical protein R3227_02885, partial [Reinekea sp.]|nr:hypothetical protein [Reinekea sp.]
MVAVTIEDTAGNGITRGDDLDDTTGITLSNTWAGTSYGGTGAGANALAHYQPTAAVGRKIGSTGGFGYNVTIGTARDITTATYRVMMFKLLWLSYAGGNTAGMRVAWGSDDSNQHWVTVGDVGQIDAPDFRYPFAGGWVIKPVDMTLNAYIAATVGTPTNTAVDTFGPWADNSSTAGSGYDLWIDALDFVETGFYATGGTGADTPVQFQDFVDEDEGEGSTNFDRVGLWQSRSQIFFFYGKHTIGTNYAGTASATDFNDSFKTVVCPGGFVREGFNALVFDITTLANVQLLTSINISGTGRSGKKYFFDATSTTSNGEVNTTTNQITITGHDLRSGEQVLYDREGNTGYVTGAAGNGDSQLVTGSSGEYYYVIN